MIRSNDLGLNEGSFVFIPSTITKVSKIETNPEQKILNFKTKGKNIKENDLLRKDRRENVLKHIIEYLQNEIKGKKNDDLVISAIKKELDELKSKVNDFEIEKVKKEEEKTLKKLKSRKVK